MKGRLRQLFLDGLLLTLLTIPSLSSWAADLRQGVERLALQLAKNVPEGRHLRIAVTDFPNLQGITSDLGRFVAERLTTRLSRNARFRVIERRRLSRVLEELRFNMSDLVDPSKARELGKIAGVEAIVVPSHLLRPLFGVVNPT